MKGFNFVKNIETYNIKDSKIAVLNSEIKNKNQLYENLKKELQLPYYFSENWDSLYDCLTDFNWVKEKGVIIKHSNIPNIDKIDLKIYFEVLEDAAESWKADDEHFLEIVLPFIYKVDFFNLMNKSS